jgi:hypothetical protein
MKESRTARRNAVARWENEGGAGRSGATVDAPGKTHRKRAPSTRGVKHSDQTASKIAGAKTMRRGHRRG